MASRSSRLSVEWSRRRQSNNFAAFLVVYFDESYNKAHGTISLVETSSKVLLWTLCLSIVAVIFATAQLFLIKKNYNFTLEATCDPTEHVCFNRDCDDEECPPNALENYRIFEVKAKDFDSCSTNDCLMECESGVIQCVEIECDSEAGDICLHEPSPPKDFVAGYEQGMYLFDELGTNQNATSTNELDKTIEDLATSTAESES